MRNNLGQRPFEVTTTDSSAAYGNFCVPRPRKVESDERIISVEMDKAQREGSDGINKNNKKGSLWIMSYVDILVNA